MSLLMQCRVIRQLYARVVMLEHASGAVRLAVRIISIKTAITDNNHGHKS